jgi:TPR repeat protein
VHGPKSDEGAELLFDRYARAAAAGSSAAQNAVAIAYLTGLGVKRDTTSGIEWLTKAADQGNSDARYNLRAACHTLSEPPVTCSQHGISTAAYFQRPGAKVLWKGDPSQ